MGGEQDILSIDKIINYPLAKIIAPLLYKLNIIPNYITFGNIILRLFIFRKMINNNDSNTLTLLLLSHFLDCLDGTMARMFNMTTKFGAMMDHISDKIFWSSMLLISVYKCRSNIENRNKLILIGIILLLSVIKCLNNKDCKSQNIIDMNAMIIIVILYNYYNKCATDLSE
jgi:phosphatidylglycerophosphate synthase